MTNANMSLGVAMLGGNPDPARGRDPDDWYATEEAATVALLRWCKHSIPQKPIWEPCAGAGHMVDGIRKELPDCTILATDTTPQRADIKTLDLFTVKQAEGRFSAIITNPPWGKAAEIIHHLRTIAPGTSLSLLLKSSYWHARGRMELFHKHPPSYILPLTWRIDFKNLGRPVMETAWNIWIPEHNGATVYAPLLHPDGKKKRTSP